MGEINVYYKTVIENHENRENMEKGEIFLHKSLSKRWFMNGVHSLLRRADCRWSADII